MTKKILNLAILTLLTTFTMAQNTEKCAAVLIEQQTILKDPSIVSKIESLEIKTQEYINRKSLMRTSNDATYTIPIVIHIIHNGEPIGTGTNISDAKIMEQIDRLNEDYRKMNSDTLDTNHPYYSIQADASIEFCLAQVDPNGNPTTGIYRYDKGQASFTIDEINEAIKPSTIWDRYNYMNIWSINIQDPDAEGVDGFGTFPGSTSDTTDGVVIANWVFGSDENGEKTIVGTHEVGHYLNLRHVWGDNQPNCGDDLVDDTPPSAEPNEGCPIFPHNPNDSCGTDANGDIFMNYMDYSDAECTVMFTIGQRDRMHATLSTERTSLTSSTACQSTLNIQDLLFDNSIYLFPNPTNGTFTIAGNNQEDIVSISVNNVVGSQVISYTNIQQLPFNVILGDLQSGIYYVSIKTSDGLIATKKIILSK